jgi:DNA repair exonuclease SbcCD nuclease subunit
MHVLRESGVTDLGGNAFLVASPLHQKISTTDPSLKLVELAADLPADAIKIGITHGALAIDGKHHPNDFPIALHAATRAGLDYLAIGHWHNWLADTDGGRIVMPGTPEPDRFVNDDSGHVALVEIDAPGQPPRIQKLPVATLVWRALTFDFLHAEASRATLSTTLAELAPVAARTVLRVTLTGTASPAALAEVRSWLTPRSRPSSSASSATKPASPSPPPNSPTFKPATPSSPKSSPISTTLKPSPAVSPPP